MFVWQNGPIETFEFEIFDKDSECLKLIQDIFDINLKDRNGIPRNICIFVNPFSGQRQGESMYKDWLQPMLELCKLQYEKHTSTHGAYFEELLNELDELSPEHPKFWQFLSFSDIVFIGGDGFSFLFYYHLSQHPWIFELFKDKSFGYLPGGSYCA